MQTRASSGHRGQRFTSSGGSPASGVETRHPSGGLSEDPAGPRVAPTDRKAPKEGTSRALSPTPRDRPTEEPARSAAASLRPGALAPPGFQQDREALGEDSLVQAPVPCARLAAGASPAEPGVSRSFLEARRALGPPPHPQAPPHFPQACGHGRCSRRAPWACWGHLEGQDPVRRGRLEGQDLPCLGLERVEGCCRGCWHPLRVWNRFYL